MVCNARATVSATISNETLAKMLSLGTLEVITPVILKNLGIKVIGTAKEVTAGYNSSLPVGTKGLEWRVAGTPSGRGYIRVYDGGIVEGYQGDEIFTQQLKEALQVQAARLVQRATLKSLQANPSIEVTQAREVSGVMVINVEV